MTPTKVDDPKEVAKQVLQAFDDLNGPQPGFRPAHAKGILLAGTFTPAPAASSLTKAPHIERASTPVTIRFSDFAGIPTVPDNDADASPRGLAIRFHLAEHVHTDIIAHSVNGFPVRTAEEFTEFLRAIHASGAGAAKPSPIEKFLGTHPPALAFVQAPKPMPSSFAKESFFAVNAYLFTNSEGLSRFGRYRILPAEGSEYLNFSAAASASRDFLFDEIKERLAKGPAKMRIAVQVAASGDVTDDSTVQWPQERPVIEFGTLEIASVAPENDSEQRHIIFDPIPRVNGIDSSGDPLLEPRATTYLMSGRRRRTAQPD